jgi:hypothetical protein
MIRILLVLAILLSPCLAVAQESGAGASEAAKDALWKTIEDALFWSKAEVRYQSFAAEHYSNLEFNWKWGALFFGMLAFAGPMMLRVWKGKWVETTWYVVGFVALCAAIWSTFAGYGDLRNRHAVLAEHWLTLEEDWKRIEADFKTVPFDQIKRQVDMTSIAQTTTRMAEPIEMLSPEWRSAWNEEARVQGREIPNVPERKGASRPLIRPRGQARL